MSLSSSRPGASPIATLEFVEPSDKMKIYAGAKLAIQWYDNDPDSSAKINLYYRKGGRDRVMIAGDIAEDADGEADRHIWKTVGLSPGKHTLEAEIIDEEGVVTVGPWGHINVLPWKCSRKPSNQEQQKGSSYKPCVKRNRVESESLQED